VLGCAEERLVSDEQTGAAYPAVRGSGVAGRIERGEFRATESAHPEVELENLGLRAPDVEIEEAVEQAVKP
jgi:hypothetical protein